MKCPSCGVEIELLTRTKLVAVNKEAKKKPRAKGKEKK